MNSSYFQFIKNNRKILSTGPNYNEILKLLNAPKPTQPIIFLQPPSSFIQEGQDIIIPNGFTVKEEINFGVIIGTNCKNVEEKHALDYVAGYCVGLDLTATSELVLNSNSNLPWSIGKGFDTICPVSRFITKQELPDPSHVRLWLMVNSKMRQEGNTNDLIFSIPYLISYISRYITLETNDLILTGTPPGISQICPGDIINGGIKDLVTFTFQVK